MVQLTKRALAVEWVVHTLKTLDNKYDTTIMHNYSPGWTEKISNGVGKVLPGVDLVGIRLGSRKCVIINNKVVRN